MSLTRRRFLHLSAAFACAPQLARADSWQGRALGADVSVTLAGPREETAAALVAIPAALRRIEALFSLYDSGSALSRLNAAGALPAPDPAFLSLLRAAGRAHAQTGGLFDPTVQPLWSAQALGGDVKAARRLIGWERLRFGAAGVVLDDGQALTLNGIAQGFATDMIRAQLASAGFTRALIQIGEHAALGGPFRLGIDDPAQGHLGHVTLADSAIATSSPGAMRLGYGSHILSPTGSAPLWSTVSIEAPTATLADALSTAAVFMPRAALIRLKAEAGLRRVLVVDHDGRLSTL
ncbi:FAD:protein FMN transferase [Cognatishimia sp. F0-27]|uniref:FAD:protein FMN transferase n=1 Tax=Cognatishimia sp. F0-27 TaxID=2816855 RepID=UPI001D0CB6FC|nr:FAD:protein FMN transferase [Cognatishimia sp. F0-27]MCC1494968.1 FAD:protein FMN transferase [Cognatishimia sp. F0-27]